ncbi:hypothetical protein [uncultured Roseibium sp.]|uniref:hypothetical protein n=1 Tax=uncultured Roseibium sp. TaxID=1936171 RepID=UPI0026251236|nr:hypothetical protein [uncultured Roseibium sp.]
MTEQLIAFVTGTAPFACMTIAAACVAAVFWNVEKSGKGSAHQSFGEWPETSKPTSPQKTRKSLVQADALAKRLPLGLAAGIAVGEVLFWVVRGSVL